MLRRHRTSARGPVPLSAGARVGDCSLARLVHGSKREPWEDGADHRVRHILATALKFPRNSLMSGIREPVVVEPVEILVRVSALRHRPPVTESWPGVL